MHIIVAGGGAAGLGTALVLARSGRRVTLVERDGLEAGDDWSAAMTWTRYGIPHFHQPHAFLPRGRRLLRALLPDVYDALLAAGATEVPVAHRAPDGARPEDADLVYLAVRRALIEWALRRAVRAEPGIAVRAGETVTGLLTDPGAPPRVRGVRTAGGEIPGDAVVDALGRRSPSADWLAAAGAARPDVETGESGVVYYSRYFRVRPGERFPDGPWLLGPRGDLGYLAFSTFLGDNDTFALVLAPGTWDHELRALRHEARFMAACRAIPALAPLVDAAFAEPATPVMAMGGLQNRLRTWAPGGAPVAAGFFPVADAYVHTNPIFALGLSMGLVHADAVARALDAHADPAAQAAAYHAGTWPEAAERFRLACDVDEARGRLWRGERLDLARRTGCYPLFALVAGNAAASRDPEIFRRVVRRGAFLDRTAALDDDVPMQERIEAVFAAILAGGPPQRPGPARDALLALLAAAVPTPAPAAAMMAGAPPA